MLNLNLLNKEQREAVECVYGPLLVLAGAGSGKTRVLTYRIANLVENYKIKPSAILALTFTNKAAREMRERTERLISSDISEMWVTTFHSFCLRVLRIDIDRLGYDRNFVIYDEQDQNTIISESIKDCNADENKYSKGMVRSAISRAKNSNEPPERFLLESSDGGDKTLVDIYRTYQSKLKKCNALDFDDLLLKTVELFRSNQDVLRKYRKKFRYVLIDEYQDTNAPQYRIIKYLCKDHRNICVVGDDDQSIYGWRGADMRNILRFEEDFPGATVVRLEQNYRSTKPILDCANKVISNNQGRKAKKLWTNKQGGAPVKLITPSNEREEAYNIARTIAEFRETEGRSYNDFAVLYRTHAQSRVLESLLVSGFGIPISVIGGTRFYARREIKDVLSYLRLISNPNDDAALRRIINVPKRSIGEASIKLISEIAKDKDQSMLITLLSPDALPTKISKKVSPFVDLIRDLFAKRYELGLTDLTEYILDVTGYSNYIVEQGDDSVETRQENIQELLGAMQEHEQKIDKDSDALQTFLELTALDSDADSIDESDGTVKLMTLHSAKGLEFPIVFIPGMEEGIFPSQRSKDERGLEEERRLCYVGVTRAQERLYLYAAKQRTLYGQTKNNPASVFLDEMGLIDKERVFKGSFKISGLDLEEARWNSRPNPERGWIPTNSFGRSDDSYRLTARHITMKESTEQTATDSLRKMRRKKYAVNERVRHPKFGDGTIIEFDSFSSAQMMTIDFDSCGKKVIAAAYVSLEKLTEEQND